VVSASLNSLRSKIRKRDPLLIYPDEQLEYQRIAEPLVERIASNVEQLREVLSEEGCEVVAGAVDSELVYEANSDAVVNGIKLGKAEQFRTNPSSQLSVALGSRSIRVADTIRGLVSQTARARIDTNHPVVLRGIALNVTQKEIDRNRTARIQLKVSTAGVATLEAWIFDPGNGTEHARWTDDKLVQLINLEWVDEFFGQLVDGLTEVLMH
jgi:hypothetical protein